MAVHGRDEVFSFGTPLMCKSPPAMLYDKAAEQSTVDHDDTPALLGALTRSAV